LKKYDSRSSYILTALLPALAFIFFLMFQHPGAPIQILKIVSLSLACTLPFVFIKRGNGAISGDDSKKRDHSTFKWFALILLIQISQLIIFQGITHSNTLISEHSNGLFWAWLFSMSLIGLLAPIKTNKTNVYPLITTNGDARKRVRFYEIGALFSLRYGTVVCFAVPLGILIAEFAKMLFSTLHMLALITHPIVAYSTLIFILPLLSSKKNVLRSKRVWRKHSNLGLFSTATVSVIIIGLIGLNLILMLPKLHSFIEVITSQPISMQWQELFSAWDSKLFPQLAWGWWFVSSPVILFFMLRISKERPLWQVLLFAMALPSLMEIQTLFPNFGNSVPSINPLLITGLSIALMLGYLSSQKDVENVLLSATLYNPISKSHRLPSLHARSFLINIFVCLFVYLSFGIFLLTAMVLTSVLFGMLWFGISIMMKAVRGRNKVELSLSKDK